jgi:hypothetical protein
MTTFVVPPAGSPAWRSIYPVPPLLRLETVGPWCPLDDTRLHVRLDGWACPACLAGWDFNGEAARWLPTAEPAVPVVSWRPSAVLVLAGLVGCAAAAAGLVMVLGSFGEDLVLVFAAVLAAAGAALVLAGLACRVRDWARYRHNTVRPVDGGPILPVGDRPAGRGGVR